MSLAQCKRAMGPAQAVRSWPVWRVDPRWLVVFIVSVVVIDGGAIGASASMTVVRPGQLLVFGLLLACSLLTVEMTRRAGENAGFILDVYAVWELPVAILLPPVYALLVPIPRFAWMQWRGRKIPV